MSGFDFGDSTLSLRALARINRVCLEYEAAWKRGERPRIEDYLGKAEGKERQELLRQLVLLDADDRAQLGEPPARAEYMRPFQEDIEPITMTSDLDHKILAELDPLEISSALAWIFRLP